MNLISIFSKYPTQEACIEHLETVRWGDNPTCPYCKSDKVARKNEVERGGRVTVPARPPRSVARPC